MGKLSQDVLSPLTNLNIGCIVLASNKRFKKGNSILVSCYSLLRVWDSNFDIQTLLMCSFDLTTYIKQPSTKITGKPKIEQETARKGQFKFITASREDIHYKCILVGCKRTNTLFPWFTDGAHLLAKRNARPIYYIQYKPVVRMKSFYIKNID